MWVMTSWGILMPGLRPADTVPAGDNRLIQIRARRKGDLVRLKKMYMPQLGEIIYLSFTDYEYRVYCTHEEWAEALYLIAMDMNYVKFKETTEEYADSKLHAAYNAIWGLLYDRFSTNRYLDKLPIYTKTAKKKKQPKQPTRWWQDV
jgi:hypothetical protein